jgi:predicted Ser/Thr protein kinase
MGIVLDIPELMEEVGRLLIQYKKKTVHDISEQNIPMMEPFRRIISQCVIAVAANDPTEWKQNGIRVVQADPSKAFGGCFCDAFNEKEPTVLGEGAYGKVYSTHKYPCAHAPTDGTQVAIKMEELRTTNAWDAEYQSPAGVRRAIDIARKASALGIAPALYDAFICMSPDKTIHIVKIMEMFDGIALNKIEWASPKHKAAARKMLLTQIEKLNKNGIIHSDLHSGNVMVHLDKRGYVDRMVIIDYDRAKYTKHFEAQNANRIISGVSTNIQNLADDSQFLNFALDRLMKTGKIIMAKTEKRLTRKKRLTKNKNIL